MPVFVLVVTHDSILHLRGYMLERLNGPVSHTYVEPLGAGSFRMKCTKSFRIYDLWLVGKPVSR